MSEPERLYDLYFDTVYKVCFLYMKNADDAKDITQETFFQMLHKPFKYESDEKAKAWLIVCASNLCKNHLKKWWFKKSVSFDEKVGNNIEDCESGTEDEYTNDVYQAVMALEDKYSIPIYLYYYEGYTTKEIANMLNSKPSTIQTRLAKAREIIKMELE